MTAPRRKREIFANPFFVVLLVASMVFVLTVLAYLVEPVRCSTPNAGAAAAEARARSRLAEWLDRNAPDRCWRRDSSVMLRRRASWPWLTDPWFSARSKPKPPRVRLAMAKQGDRARGRPASRAS